MVDKREEEEEPQEDEEKQERRRRRGRKRRRDGSRVIMGEHEGEDEGCGRKGREGERGG